MFNEQSNKEIESNKLELRGNRRLFITCPFNSVIHTLDKLYGLKPINVEISNMIMHIYHIWYEAIFNEVRFIRQQQGHFLRIYWIEILLGIDKSLFGDLFEHWKRKGTNEYIDNNDIIENFEKFLHISILLKQPSNAISILSIVKQYNNFNFKEIYNLIVKNNIRVFFYPNLREYGYNALYVNERKIKRALGIH